MIGWMITVATLSLVGWCLWRYATDQPPSYEDCPASHAVAHVEGAPCRCDR